jgi:hypothetical protein
MGLARAGLDHFRRQPRSRLGGVGGGAFTSGGGVATDCWGGVCAISGAAVSSKSAKNISMRMQFNPFSGNIVPKLIGKARA